MTDYKTLIDAETWAFIERTNSFYPPDTIDSTIEKQREIYDRMCRAFHSGYPEGVTAETTAIDVAGRALPIRIYRGAKADPSAVVLYLHGGGFILGGLESHDDVCAEICARTGFELVSVDYRLAPEHLHPAQSDDAMSGFQWVARMYEQPIVLAGDSAGGNLAAGIAHRTRNHPRAPIGQVLVYPGLGGDQTKGSYVTHAEAPMLTARDLDFYRDIRTGGVDASNDVTHSPLAEKNYVGLPPTVVVTAECDPLSSDGETYRDRILAAGGKAFWIEEPGLIHSFMRGRHTIKRAREAFTHVVDAVKALGQGTWIY